MSVQNMVDFPLWIDKEEMQLISQNIRSIVDELNGRAFRQSFERNGWMIEFSATCEGGDYYMDEFTMSPLFSVLSTRIINL